MIKNLYQVIGITQASRKVILGSYETLSQAEEKVTEAKAQGFYIDYRISKMYQYLVRCFDKDGGLIDEFLCRSKIQAEQALTDLRQEFHKVEIVFIGGNDE
ncbi:hypothetical protein [Otariodibacter oris]|uniref:Uncharacterized protein n=1 Tax=Otariodibacter oris TaxID=1032623 RepID=A0A420XFD5_9PAST|nr:hypothetical protein [Otariodibacter oris]QGM81479.1 hypothetical protein A6A10_08695 [Otariodibacter oris]RKR71082.1 hypothetical protein DES31_1659 [Otariodibacter oris]